MKTKLKLNKDYSQLKDWVLSMPEIFDTEGEFVVDGRNQVKIIDYNNNRYVVKYFRRITKANRVIYNYFRASKGERAYCNANILLSKGISTPMPVAYYDVFEKGRLKYSYFISEYVDCPSAFDIINRPLMECEAQLKQLAAFFYKIHKKGVFHADLNLTNVLYCPDDILTPFSLIDNNRIRFKRYTKRRAMRNLRRIQIPIVNYAALMNEYAKLSEQDVFGTIGAMMFYRGVNREFRSLRKSLKRKLMWLLHLKSMIVVRAEN